MTNPVIVSVGGGKGGVGKSTVSANLGALLVRSGRSVGFIDADLGGANLHLCLGIRRPATGLQDYLRGKSRDLREVAVPTKLARSWLISGASDILELANPTFAYKQKIIRNLAKMEADFIFVDLGAGSDNNVTDFFAAFPYGVIVTDGLPTSVENAYGFLKNGVLRGLVRMFSGHAKLQNHIKRFADPESGRNYATVDEMVNGLQDKYPDATKPIRSWLQQRRTFLVLNMVRDAGDVKVGERFTTMVKKYLSIRMQYIGYVVYSSEMRDSIKAMLPLVEYNPESKASECFQAIAQNLIALTKG
jgi:flagellar biosynthesis protein FlhG